MSPHPEEFCQRCQRPNVWSWSAPSPLWNAVLRDPVTLRDKWNVLCPPCFAELAAAKGIVPAGRNTWRFYPDSVDVASLWDFDGGGYVWNSETWLWEAAPPSEETP